MRCFRWPAPLGAGRLVWRLPFAPAVCAICAGACPMIGCWARAAAVPSRGQSRAVKVEASAAWDGLSSTHDFGPVDPLTVSSLQYAFTVRNAKKVPLVVDRIQTSCHCTSALAGRSLPVEIATGGSLLVTMTVDLEDVDSGRMSKTTWVFNRGSSTPVASFTLTADVRPLATFSPASLDFGPVLPGPPAIQTFELRIDRRVTDASGWPGLVCSDARMHVERIGSTQAGAGVIDPAGYRHARYEVRLPADGRGGILSGTIRFTPPMLPSGQTALAYGSALPAAARAALARAFVSFRAEIMGPIRSHPALVVFGFVPKGNAASRVIEVEAASEEAPLTAVSAVCSSPLIAVHALPIGGNGTWFFEVSLTRDAPLGVLECELRIKGADGSLLIVPVRGYVVDGLRRLGANG